MLFAAFIDQDFWGPLRTGMSLTVIVLSLFSAIVCFMAMRFSARMSIVAIGFLAESLAGLCHLLIIDLWFNSSPRWPDENSILNISLGLSFLSITGTLLICLGLMFVFADVSKRLSHVATTKIYAAPPGESAESHPWRPRQEGSHDIQS